MPTYKEHHARYSYGWASEQGTAVEVAKRSIDQWNAGLPNDEPPYKKTPAFIRALGILIFLRRQGVEIKEIPDNDPNGYDIDPLCLACRACKK